MNQWMNNLIMTKPGLFPSTEVKIALGLIAENEGKTFMQM